MAALPDEPPRLPHARFILGWGLNPEPCTFKINSLPTKLLDPSASAHQELELQVCGHHIQLDFLLSWFSIYFYFMCSSALPAHMSVYHIHAWCPMGPEEGIISPRTGVTANCQLPRGCWELHPRPLEDVLTTEQSLKLLPFPDFDRGN